MMPLRGPYCPLREEGGDAKLLVWFLSSCDKEGSPSGGSNGALEHFEEEMAKGTTLGGTLAKFEFFPTWLELSIICTLFIFPAILYPRIEIN